MKTTISALPPVEHLWELYREVGSVHRLADQIGISHSRIHRALTSAGYRLNGSKYSPEDDEVIRRYYLDTPPDVFSLAELTAALGRAWASNVSRRARELGLSDMHRPMNAESRRLVTARHRTWHATNEHPKGMLGKKHGPEALEVIAKRSAENWQKMPQEKREAKTLKMLKTKAERGNMVNPRPHASWKAGWREVGGRRVYFRSQWEVNYARYLQWLKEKGQIIEWEFEPETFWFEGVKRGTRSYLPDFRIIELNGEKVYHEIKGWMDDRSKTKIKRMAKYHPDVKLIVIDAPAYRALARQVKGLVPEWE